MADGEKSEGKQRNFGLNLSHLTPEEIAKRMLETPPPKVKRKRGKKTEDQQAG
jgi:hypothetical protein